MQGAFLGILILYMRKNAPFWVAHWLLLKEIKYGLIHLKIRNKGGVLCFLCQQLLENKIHQLFCSVQLIL